jgi:hypothetical protein
MKGDTLLVGSIPLRSTGEAIETFGTALGAHLASLPDGEVGWRQFWVSRVHFQVFAIHPDLEVIQRPRPDDGAERVFPHDATDNWNFRVREGVERVTFGHPGWRLGFYQEAVNSYHVFKELKRQGRLPEGLRFQVSIPTAVSALPPRVFPTPGDLEKVRPGYIEAARAEIAGISREIPPTELAIQWDCSTELQDAYGMVKGPPPEGMIKRNLDQITALSRDIPGDVLLGFHLCFGTLGGWPRFAPDSTDKAVELANAFIAGAGRRVDWMHIPVLERTDDAYYAPLADLKAGSTRIYLGMIHNMASFPERLAVARRHLKDFGVAAYCGFGRRPPSEMSEILTDHISAVEFLRRG